MVVAVGCVFLFVGVAAFYLAITLPAGALLQVIERRVAIAR